MAISIFNNGYTPPSYSDEQLLAMLKAGGQEMESALFSMFYAFAEKARYAYATHQLSEDEIMDCYGDALMQTRDNVQKDLFLGNSALKTYFGRIFYFKCIDKIRSASTNRRKEEDAVNAFVNGLEKENEIERALMEEEFAAEDRQRKICLDRARASLSLKDQDLLVDSVILEIKNRDLVEKYQYESNKVVASTLYNLKRKLKQTILDLCKSDPKCSLLCNSTDA